MLEVRSSSYRDPAFYKLMEKHEAAIAWVEAAKVPLIDEVTADFVYARLRECSDDEPTGYPPAELDKIAKRFQATMPRLAATASSISSTAPKSAPRVRRWR